MIVKRLFLCAMLVTCLALAGPAWAGTLEFTGTDVNGQGTLNFNPAGGVGVATLTIGAGGGGNGALIQDLFDTLGLCGGGGCSISSGYMTLTSGTLLAGGGCTAGNCTYNFGAGGVLDIYGTITTSLGTSSGLLFSANFASGGALTTVGTVGTYAGALTNMVLHGGAFGNYTFSGGSGDAITISINSGCGTGGDCTGLVDQASVSLQTIPEPATLSILGTALLALGTGLRRKMIFL